MFPRRLVQILIISIMLIALLPVLQASAEKSTLDISVTEHMDSSSTYTPTNPGPGGNIGPITTAGDGSIIITNELTSTDLYNVVVKFNTGNTFTPWSVDGSGASASITNGGLVQTVNIPHLAPKGFVKLNYQISNAAKLPVQLSVTYDNNKVNIGGSTNVQLVITKDNSVLTNSVTGITVHVVPATTLGVKDWTFSNVLTNPDGSITWAPADLTSSNSQDTLGFTATEANSAAHTDGSSDVQIYDMATSFIQYSVTSTTNTAASVSVSGSPSAQTTGVTSNLAKQYVSGTQWSFTPKVTNSNAEDVTFTLNSVTFWATPNSDPNSAVSSTIQTFTPLNYYLSQGSSWTNPAISVDIGTTPAGFIKSDLTVKDDSTQMPKTYVSQNDPSGSVSLVKQIWVYRGYNIEVTKAITKDGDNFRITITVKNTGSKQTPDNVLVYDIVPTATFTVVAGSMNPDPGANHQSVSTPGMSGMAYWWNVGPLGPQGSISPVDTRTITYEVSGSGDYPISDIFLIGVDPAQSVNLQSTPNLQTNATVVNSNLESVMAVGALCLVLIGMIGTVRRRF